MKRMKKTLIVLIALCLVFSQGMLVQAKTSSKKAKYSVTMDRNVYTMKKGKKVALKAKVNKAAKKKGVQWTSSNTKVAEVTSKGKVTAKGKGKATITVKVKGTKVKATCKIVVGTPVKKITLNSKNLNLNLGENYTLKAKVSPKKPTNKKVTYTSSNQLVATVNKKGVVKAVRPGTAKITVKAADGAGAKAICNVVVKSIAVSSVSLNKTYIEVKPGDKDILVAKVQPANATNGAVQWTTSNANVVTVDNNGTISAVGEGTATITAVADGKSASCFVKVAYSGQVKTQQELNQALSSKMVTDIVYTSNARENVKIPQGDYSSKTITINAPNADVENGGKFSKVTIQAIAQNTYYEKAENVIYFQAPKGRIIVESTGLVTINMDGSGQDLNLENNGNIRDLNVPTKTILSIAGRNVVPISLGRNATDTSITTSTELNIESQARWNMAVLPGAENTKAVISNEECLPIVTGVGCVPVTVEDENDVVNIPAEADESLGIEQVVDISGNIEQIALKQQEDNAENADEQADSESGILKGASADVEVYLLPYMTSNSDMEKNYETYIKDENPKVTTDATGNYLIESVSIGNYWMIFEKQGYRTVVKNVIITSSNSEQYSNGTMTMLSDEIANVGEAEQIGGTIVNGLTGNSVNVEGIKVKLRQGSGNITGDVLKETTTDGEGKYEFSNVAAGVYTIEVVDLRQNLPSNAVRYNSASKEIVVVPGYLSTNEYNCVVNPQMQSITGDGQVQFTLTWGTEESGASEDIDSHLIGPRADGNGNFHVYFGDDIYEYGDQTFADLDVDDTDYEGPEHTTIYQETPGIYHFYVHNYSESNQENSDMMTKSSIQVRITIGANSVVYNCPNEIGNLWYVCDYDSVTHTIIPVNKMNTFIGSTSDIGISDEEIYARRLERAKDDARDAVGQYKSKLAVCEDNDAKQQCLKKTDDWLKEIEQETDCAKLEDREQKIEKETQNLLEEPVFSVEGDSDISSEQSYIYDDDDDVIRTVVTVSSLYGDVKADNVKVSPFVEGGTVGQLEPCADDEGYTYVVKVTTSKGLVYKLYVRMVSGQAQIELQDMASRISEFLDIFDENDDIRIKRTKLSELQGKIPEVKDREAYDEVYDVLEEMELDLQQKNAAFEIDTVRSGDSIDDWETYDRDSVLEIHTEDGIGNQALLDKLEVGFYYDEEPTVSYQITRDLPENSGYIALIKATDSKTGYVKNIYVCVVDYSDSWD